MQQLGLRKEEDVLNLQKSKKWHLLNNKQKEENKEKLDI